MPQTGDERCCGGHTRCYFDQQWDVILTDDDKFYWRDKLNHVTYDCNLAPNSALHEDELGEAVPLFDDEKEVGKTLGQKDGVIIGEGSDFPKQGEN